MSASDLTLAELRTELQARGFDHLSTTRATYFINAAYSALCDSGNWPFLEATTTGTAPLSISDLGRIEYVIDSTSGLKLAPVDRRGLTDTQGTDLTLPGSPYLYYLTSGNTINVYPTSTTDSLTVRYWKVPTALSGDSDTPLVPNRYRLNIVNGAVAWAYRDNDELDAAAATEQVFRDEIERMRDDLMHQAAEDRPDYILITADPLT